MRAFLHLLLAALFGAAFAGLVSFLVQGYQLVRRGVERDTLPLLELARDVMHLEFYAIAGAVAGVLVAAVALLIGRSRARNRRGDLAARRMNVADPDALIRLRRAEGVDRYLREREG